MKQNNPNDPGNTLSSCQSSKTGFRLASILLFALALSLRTCGLSHDLHLGRVYHPDTPKQMRAIERFVDGEYYTVIGGRDYEGYPYFNSHLVEYLVRVYQFTGSMIVRHLGVADSISIPSYLSLFWITRILNATLSAFAVVVVLLIGWRWIAPAAGVIAGLLLALSPIDITACHYANGDSTAAFFALAGVWIALHILERPTWKLYLAAGLVSAAAFSSKYHGGIALGTAGLAHIFYYSRMRRLFSGASIGRGLFLLISFIIGVLLTSPALLIYPEKAFEDIVQFFEYTASFGMTSEMQAMNTWQRFIMGMSVNMPAMLNVVGLIPAIAALFAVVFGFRRPAIWLIASVPLVYILAGLATKPLTHAVYHTMATPGIMLLAGFALHKLTLGHKMIWLRKSAFGLLATLALGYLAIYSHRELFFFLHNDTRHLAECWARDNIPSSFKLFPSPYTFDNDGWHSNHLSEAQDHSAGEAHVFSGRTGIRPPAGSLPVHTFQVESEKLVIFRNWPQYFFINQPLLIDRLDARPGFQPIPSPHDVNLIDADAPWWVRHPGTWILMENSGQNGSLTSTNPIKKAAWYIRNTGDPAEISMEFGDRHQTVRLAPGETIIAIIADPKPEMIYRVDRNFYSWGVHVRFGSIRASLLTSARDIAWAYFNAGQFDKAAELMDQIPGATLTRGDRIIHEISGLSSNPSIPALTETKHEDLSPPNLFDDYGISSGYLQKLPGIAWQTNTWDHISVTNALSGDYLFDEFRLPEVMLDTGLYRLELENSSSEGRIELVLLDDLDRPQEVRTRDVISGKDTNIVFHFAVDQQDNVLRPRIRFNAQRDRVAFQKMAIRPDIEATLASYSDLQSFLRGIHKDTGRAERFWYEPLLGYANQLAKEGDTSRAREFYLAAINASPNRRVALERLLTLSGDGGDMPENFITLSNLYKNIAPQHVMHPSPARFATGVDLTGYQLSATKVKAGDSIGILTHWNPEKLNRNVRRQAAWLHFIPEGQKQAVFQGDQPLLRLIRANRLDEDKLLPGLIEIQVPPETPPGRYKVKTGIWIPSQRKRIKVTEAAVEHDRRSVVLTTIEVLP